MNNIVNWYLYLCSSKTRKILNSIPTMFAIACATGYFNNINNTFDAAKQLLIWLIYPIICILILYIIKNKTDLGTPNN